MVIDSYSITGGDPLLNPDVWWLISELRRDKKKVTILGVPETITEVNLKKMKSLEIDSYQVSLDGMEKTHDNIRGRGSFTRTIEALKKLNLAGIQAKVMFTMSKQNFKEMFRLIEYLENLNLNQLKKLEGTASSVTGEEAALVAHQITLLKKEIQNVQRVLEQQGRIVSPADGIVRIK